MMLLFEAFLTSIVLVGAAELSDRTQLAALSLALKFRENEFQVIAGTLCAFALTTAIAVIFGAGIVEFVKTSRLTLIVSVLFIGLGLYSYFDWGSEEAFEHELAHKKYRPKKSAFATAFGMVFSSELLDKTQIVTILLTANYPTQPLAVFAGVMLSLSAITFVSVIFRTVLHEIYPVKLIRIGSAVLLGLFGILTLITSFFI